jgi:hypothetical protein
MLQSWAFRSLFWISQGAFTIYVTAGIMQLLIFVAPYFEIVQTVILQIRVYVLLGGTRKVGILMTVLFLVQAISSAIIGVLTDERVKGVCFHRGSHIRPLTFRPSFSRTKPSQNLFPEFISAHRLAFPVGAVSPLCRL